MGRLLPVWILIVALPSPAAEVYRCVKDGKTLYTDAPCQPGAAPAQLPPITPIDRQPVNTPLERQFDAKARREAANKRKADEQWSQAYAAKKTHDEGVRAAIIEHRLIKGMTMSEVRQSIGEPTSIDGEASEHPRWLYQNGRERRTLSFTRGLLSSDRTRTSRR